MQQLQDELDLARPDLGISIVGVNEVGFEGCVEDEDVWDCPANVAMCEGRDMPWLQDVPEVDVWTLWDVAYRDLVILDGDNRIFATYNVTEHNLSLPEDYEGLRTLLLAAAGVSD